ncbi:MAG: glycosyltransferase family 4 protein [Pseudomonadota bacterium]
MTRILYLTPGCFDKGGISRYSRYQIAALRELVGVDNLRAASLLGPDANGFEEPFEVSWFGPNGDATLASRVGFARFALTQVLLWRPQIIFCAHVNFTPMVRWLASLCGAKTVLNVYGLELWSGLSQKRLRAMLAMDHVISDCHATADHVGDNAMHPDRPTVIWDCVDLEKFSPGTTPPAVLERYGIPDRAGAPVILTLGRLAKAAAHKGYDRLIKNFATLLKTMPEARLVIAGRGDMRAELEALAQREKCDQAVIFTGSVDEQDMADIYRCATIFSLVSDKGDGRGEGIPLTPLEAMACGIPIIVGDEDGSREAVVERRNGMVISPRDPSAHVAAMETLIDQADAKRADARRVAQEHFSYEGFVEKHRAFLDRVR